MEEIGYAPTVLIVDDLEINRRLLRAMLRTTNYRFLEARRAEDALHILATEPVDLVILDLMLPDMDGLPPSHWLGCHGWGRSCSARIVSEPVTFPIHRVIVDLPRDAPACR